MLYHNTFKDVYCSQEDGLAEKRHVFLQGNGLPERWKIPCTKPFIIAETGFGMGLTFLATWQAWENAQSLRPALHYLSIDKELLPGDAIGQLGKQWPELSPYTTCLLSRYSHTLAGRVSIELTPTLTLTLLAGDIHDMLPLITLPVDAWYLDGFAPAKNPDMWTDDLFNRMRLHTNYGGTVATYTAASLVRNGLKQAGFDVSKIRGYGKKRDMLVGRFCAMYPDCQQDASQNT